MNAGHETRRELRSLLCALLARGRDTQGLYVPRGEAGMRRMIASLLAMGAGEGAQGELATQIERFCAGLYGGADDEIRP